MKPNFKTPVSMQVTEEQYKRDLEKPLLAMGYRWNDININDECQHEYDYSYIQTNYNNGTDTLGMYSEDEDRYHVIKSYNPKLFLAIAGMTEGDEWIVGEWLYYMYGKKMFKCSNNTLDRNDIEKGYANYKNQLMGSPFRKATLEELTEHFSKTDVTKGGEDFMHNATHAVTIHNQNQFPKEMIVSDDEDFSSSSRSVVVGYDSSLQFPYLTKQNENGSIFCFKYAKDVPEEVVEEEIVKEMTVSEIQEKLGFKIKIVE